MSLKNQQILKNKGFIPQENMGIETSSHVSVWPVGNSFDCPATQLDGLENLNIREFVK